MKGSLIIVGFFALGCLFGIFQWIPFDIAETDISFYALCALMFSVGVSIGNDPQTLKNFRSLNPRLVFLPVMTILGTTIALLSNIMREIITLLCAPLLVRWFGNLAPISAGGATTMDTTLPIITRYAGQQFVVVSIFHGFVVDFSVPFLVTFFCSI